MFENWIENRIVQYSYGNGSAMRVSPIIDYFNSYNGKLDKIAIMAQNTALCTRRHPEGIKGAVTISLSGHMASKRAQKKEILNYVESIYDHENYAYPASIPIETLRENYKWSSTCQNTVPVAIRCFLDSTDYESCIRNCLSLTCDMDTMCCIAGGIA